MKELTISEKLYCIAYHSGVDEKDVNEIYEGLKKPYVPYTPLEAFKLAVDVLTKNHPTAPMSKVKEKARSVLTLMTSHRSFDLGVLVHLYNHFDAFVKGVL